MIRNDNLVGQKESDMEEMTIIKAGSIDINNPEKGCQKCGETNMVFNFGNESLCKSCFKKSLPADYNPQKEMERAYKNLMKLRKT